MSQDGPGGLLRLFPEPFHGQYLQTSNRVSKGKEYKILNEQYSNFCFQDITFLQIRALLDYMYKGEVSVQEEELPALLKIAEALKVKGLVESDDNLAAKKITSSSKTLKNGGGKVWPVSTSKLMKTETDGDDPGTLVIDEESNDMAIAPVEVDYDPSYVNEDTPPAPGMVKTIGPNGKVEWKRYKQYTKDDILAAIEEVKAGKNNFPFQLIFAYLRSNT